MRGLQVCPSSRLLCACVATDRLWASVRIDVDQLLYDRAIERIKADEEATKVAKAKPSRKRKADGADGPRPKKPRTKSVKKEQGAVPLPSPLKIAASKVTLKLGPKPKEPDVFPCCLCVSTNREGLLRVHDPPVWQKEGESGESSSTATEWMAHEECAHVVPETWVDDMVANLPDGSKETQRLVFGVDAIVKDRWNLVNIFLVHGASLADLLIYPEMQRLHKDKAKGSRCSNPVYEGQMSQGISRIVRTRRGQPWHSIQGDSRN